MGMPWALQHSKRADSLEELGEIIGEKQLVNKIRSVASKVG